jgi:hypothetical protein
VLPDNANFEEVEGLVKEAVPPAGNRLPPAPARKKARPKSDPGNDPGFDGLMK